MNSHLVSYSTVPRLEGDFETVCGDVCSFNSDASIMAMVDVE